MPPERGKPEKNVYLPGSQPERVLSVLTEVRKVISNLPHHYVQRTRAGSVVREKTARRSVVVVVLTRVSLDFHSSLYIY